MYWIPIPGKDDGIQSPSSRGSSGWARARIFAFRSLTFRLRPMSGDAALGADHDGLFDASLAQMGPQKRNPRVILCLLLWRRRHRVTRADYHTSYWNTCEHKLDYGMSGTKLLGGTSLQCLPTISKWDTRYPRQAALGIFWEEVKEKTKQKIY